MKKLALFLLGIALSWGCSGNATNPLGTEEVYDDNPFGLPSIDAPATINIVETGMMPASEEDLARLISEGKVDASALELEGGLCPVLIDCWWVDEEEFFQDFLWENYCWNPQGTMYFVWLAKLPDPTEPCPIPVTEINGWLAFTQCDTGKPRPRLHSNVINVAWEPYPYYKGLWYFYVAITITGMPPGYHDSAFVVSWDGPALFPIDDVCGMNFWENQQGGYPPLLWMVFNPEPPFPPGGWPPCRTVGEDGETRPWCVLFP